MSETSKTADAAKRATDRYDQAAIEAAGKVSKEALNETTAAAQAAAVPAKEMTHVIAETVAHTADAAADISSRAAGQSREAMLLSVRTAAGVGSRVADISFDRGHRWLASAAQAMDIYRDATERSAGRVQALFASNLTFGLGLQAIQHAWLEMIDHTMDKAARKPWDMLRCNNVVELAEAQRDFYVDAIDRAFESTGRLLDIAGRTAQDAVRPLRSHSP